MPRYLTPAKICLLVLIDVYMNDEVALDARLGVIDLLQTAILPPTDYDDGELDKRLHLSSSSLAAIAEPLTKLSSNFPGRSVYDVLLQRIWAWDGLDALHVFFEHLEGLLAQPMAAKPSRSSPLGQFIRRCSVEFTRLQFVDTDALWRTFESYRRPSFDAWSLRNPNGARTRQQTQPMWARAGADGTEAAAGSISGFSVDDTETLLSFSVHRLQKLGTRISPDVRQRLERWVESVHGTGAQSLQHFLAFFDYWKAGQCTMAQESLQRYFDYSLVKQSGADPKVYYQYALLHKSVLFADFERWEDSVDAMDECITTARENQDTACLNFALSWLMYLRQAYPRTQDVSFTSLANLLGGANGEQDEIAFLKTKAQESKHWSLLSSTLLEESKLEVQNAGNTPKSLEPIYQAAYLNVQHDLRTLMPAVSMFQAAVYERLGQADLAQRYYESVRSVHYRHAPLSDLARSTCRIVRSLAQAGHYDRALDLLEETEGEVSGVLKLQQRHQAFRGLVLLQRFLRNDDNEGAIETMALLRPMSSLADPELQLEIELLSLELKSKMRNSGMELKSMAKMIGGLQRNSKSEDIALHAELFVLRLGHRNGLSIQTRGLTQVIRAAMITLKHMLVPTFVEAVLVLVNILAGALQEYDAAVAYAKAILPRALQLNNPAVVGEVYFALADALRKQMLVGKPPLGKSKHQAMLYFSKAKEFFDAVEMHSASARAESRLRHAQHE